MLIPGQACTFASRAPCPYIRLAFSRAKLEDMDFAARTLAEIIREEQRVCASQQQRLATQP